MTKAYDGKYIRPFRVGCWGVVQLGGLVLGYLWEVPLRLMLVSIIYSLIVKILNLYWNLPYQFQNSTIQSYVFLLFRSFGHFLGHLVFYFFIPLDSVYWTSSTVFLFKSMNRFGVNMDTEGSSVAERSSVQLCTSLVHKLECKYLWNIV